MRLSQFSDEIKGKTVCKIPELSDVITKNGIEQKELLRIISHIQEDEKTKIGHELHDSVNPLLAVALLYLQSIKAKTKEEKFIKEQIELSINAAIENVRSISSQLAVSKKTHFSLVQQITDIINNINAARHLQISFEHSPESRIARLPHLKKIALLRIAQEQINNIMKHSGAKHAEVKLFYRNKMVHLSIADDGIGFDASKSTKGIGLLNIATRIKQFNGETKLETALGKGCKLDIMLPA